MVFWTCGELDIQCREWHLSRQNFHFKMEMKWSLKIECGSETQNGPLPLEARRLRDLHGVDGTSVGRPDTFTAKQRWFVEGKFF